jgi:hypothetical protein
MSEKPMMFRGDMVEAILSGQKTQTRRLAKGDDHARYDPGDSLWVKETFKIVNEIEEILLPRPSVVLRKMRVLYRADGHRPGIKWTSPLYMPKWASRIWLDVIDVRKENLQDITPEDARREGAPEMSGQPVYYALGPEASRQWYRALWDDINKKRGYGWNDNQPVWVVTFRAVQA